MPGDLNNASSFWPGVGDGDGDGFLAHSPDDPSGVEDGLIANLHLAKAGLIPDQSVTGTLSKYSLDLQSLGSARIIYTGAHSGWFVPSSRNVMQFGAGQHNDDALLVPKQSYKMDNKLDDALPKSGKMTFRIFSTSTDAACTNSSTSYYLTSSTVGCTIVLDLEL